MLLALPVAACGREDTGVSPPAPTTGQLSDALLTVADLGDLGGPWTETQRDVFTVREPENPSIDPSLWCPAGKGDDLVTLAGPAGADVELTLDNPDAPYLVRQQAWANADVAEYLASVKAAVTACSGATWTDEGGNAYTLQPAASVPAVGDDSASWRVTIELAGGRDTSMSFTDQTVARFGPALMVLQAGAAPVASPDVTAPNYVALLRTAAAKMSELSAP